MSTKAPEAPSPLAISPEELQGILIEFGLMKERERKRLEDEARAAAKQEAADEERRRVDIKSQPLVTVEWERSPDEHACYVGGRKYTGRGPLVNRAFTPPRKVRPGERQQIPACDAVVLEESGFVTVVEGRQHCRWTPIPFMPGVQGTVPPPDSKQWEEMAV